MLNIIAPKKFLCKYPLSNGAILGSIILIIVTGLCALVLLIEVLTMDRRKECSHFLWKNGFSFSVTGIVYSVAMIVVHFWLLWGIKKKKASVVLSWVVITGMWLAQTFCLLMVLILMHSAHTSLVIWLLSTIFGVIAMCILIYIVLVVYGFWLELKQEGHQDDATA